jgi:glycosyltransferase involved in cell wall biosynthesis
MESRRILLLTYISPLQKWGSAQRTRFLIEALQQHGQVDVVSLSFGTRGAPAEQTLPGGARLIDIPVPLSGLAGRPRLDIASSHVSDVVARHVDLAGYDLIVSRYVKPALKLNLPAGVPLIVDFDDAVYEPPWKALKTLKSWVGVFLRLLNDRVIVRTRLRREPFSKAHYFFCRDAERRVFPWLQSSSLPNLPARPERPGPPSFEMRDPPALMFIGLLDYMPNQDAIDWFLQHIWPVVRASVPQARFLIVGSTMTGASSRWTGHPGVVMTGFVDSLSDTYAEVRAAVVPMRSGAGTNIKALEPYLYGRPVIATSLVRDGHGSLFREGSDMLTADDPQAFARHCIDLLTDPARAERIARDGHARVTSVLTVQNFQATVSRAVQVLWAAPQPRPEASAAQAAELP